VKCDAYVERRKGTVKMASADMNNPHIQDEEDILPFFRAHNSQSN
jgi:hypothetical protein